MVIALDRRSEALQRFAIVQNLRRRTAQARDMLAQAVQIVAMYAFGRRAAMRGVERTDRQGMRLDPLRFKLRGRR